jgi:hypothetical protein
MDIGAPLLPSVHLCFNTRFIRRSSGVSTASLVLADERHIAVDVLLWTC